MRYDQYKQTEIPWIESLPAHWDQIRNGGLFNPHQDKVGEHYSTFDLLSLTTQGVRCKDIHDVKGKVPASYEDYQIVNPGDMVFCLFDLDCSAVFSGLSEYRGMITSAYDVVKPKASMANSRYLDYWFQSVFAGRYYKIFSKSVRYTINYDIFKAIKTPVPPRDEQDQIVRYLDWKTSYINKLIHGYQREIALLEEQKATITNNAVVHGVDPLVDRAKTKAAWMGLVPLTWQQMRMKNFFSEINERSIEGKEPHLSMSQKLGLVTDDESIGRPLLSESYAGAKLCEKDDLVLNRLKAHLGVFALAPIHGVVSPDYTVLRLDQNRILPKYAEYLLKSNDCRRELRIRVRGIVEGFWRLYTDDLGAIPVCLPSVEEQKRILEYIAQKTASLDTAIIRIAKQIALLREYRTRLISDVVTGQIDVRGIEIPEYEPENDTDELEAVEDEEAEE